MIRYAIQYSVHQSLHFPVKVGVFARKKSKNLSIIITQTVEYSSGEIRCTQQLARIKNHTEIDPVSLDRTMDQAGVYIKDIPFLR